MTTVSKQEFTEYIRKHCHKELFNYLGWDNDRTMVPSQNIGDEIVTPKIIAEKNGFKIITVQSVIIPQYVMRSKVVVALKKLFAESIIIFSGKDKYEQVWRYGKVEIKYNNHQDTERLYQRTSGLIFDIDEQDNITIVDVTARVKTNFAINTERVTKKFYEAFRKEHKALLELISGIANTFDREWYASIMLNRLMFCYFMQRRGFLNNDRNYLRNKLNESLEKLGKGKFYSFYRSFLMVLFQKGFGTYEHPADVMEMIGKIPYLNGGLFDLHEVENNNPSIDISDDAFERIFDLFDKYEWHLDTRDCATGNEISPDVLGYIFEKYINDRAAMGAYYTQEDITGYISRSTILPYLLDSVRKSYPKPFEKNGTVWAFLRDSGDAYIFDSVKKGVDLPLPEYIETGVDTTVPNLIEKRKAWNTPALTDYALPTEIWREVVDRRNRYNSVKSKIMNGEIFAIADFITYNLDIVSFMGDLLQTIDDPKFIEHFYRHLERITVLDPTCGSGAFLFAAMNILEPLYDTCLSRMKDYLDSKIERATHRYFDEKLEQMEDSIHPNKHYFIYKSIILNNLYGVDIMREAVETAKLRLFLKLVSTAEPQRHKDNYGIEPLPDIDFNVKCGNTLIGYANENEIDDGLRNLLIGDMRGQVKDDMLQLSKATARYKELQLGAGDYRADDFKSAKKDLSDRQAKLRGTLDTLLRKYDYARVNVNDTDWQNNYAPFHWVSEFYSIIAQNGGFDVVIGNPPYVVYSERQCGYVLKGYQTQVCKDLYAFVIERVTSVIAADGKIGMITPISLISTDGFQTLRDLLYRRMGKLHFSSYSMRPAKLFDGVEKHLTIMLAEKGNSSIVYSSNYFRWKAEFRSYLFDSIQYVQIKKGLLHNGSIPKISNSISVSIFEKLKASGKIGLYFVHSSKYTVFHTRKLRYFLQFLDCAPKIYEQDNSLRVTSELKQLHFGTDEERLVANAVYLSTLFFWYYISYSDCRNLNKREVITFPYRFSDANENELAVLSELSVQILKNLQDNSKYIEANYAEYGLLKMQTFRPKLSKPIADHIDAILAEHYGFSDEELDYIINYDIKYRMGIGSEAGDDD